MTSRVLVVEDEPALARGLADHFHAEGYDVRVIGRGDQAVPAIRDFRPQLVVLDILLPGRSGLDVLRELRAAGDRVPVLMLTAKGEVVDRVVGLELGADDYLAKPFACVSCWRASAPSCAELRVPRRRSLPRTRSAAYGSTSARCPPAGPMASSI